MTTPTDQIRAALQKVVDYLPALRDIPPTIAQELSYAFIESKEALSLLDTHVLVPREPTKQSLKGMFDACGLVRQSKDMARTYKAAIAPYVPEGE